VDFYNERYEDALQWGLRQAYSGTGIAKPFAIGHWQTSGSKDAGNKLIIMPSGAVAVARATSTIPNNTAFYVASSGATNLVQFDATPGATRFTVTNGGAMTVAGTSTLASTTIAGRVIFSSLTDGCLSTVSNILTSSGAPCGSGGGGGGALSTTTDIIGDGGLQDASYVTGDVMFGGSSSTTAEFQFDDDGGKFIISSSSANATATIESNNTAQAVRIGDDSNRGIEWLFNVATDAVLQAYGTVTQLIISLTTVFQGDVTVTGVLDFEMPYRNYVDFFDDYLTETTNAGDAPWFESITGTGAGCTNAAIAVGNRPGMTLCTTGTTATGRAGLMTGLTAVALGQGTTTYNSAIRVTTLSDATNRYSLRVGFKDTATANQVDGAYLLYDEGGVTTGSTASANWYCVTASNSTRTFTDTGTAVSAGGWDDIEIIVNGGGTSVGFYIDGVLECTHTTNIPTGTARALGHGVQMLKSLGTTARTYDVDYQYARHDFTTAR
jgi:hypothetical protein